MNNETREEINAALLLLVQKLYYEEAAASDPDAEYDFGYIAGLKCAEVEIVRLSQALANGWTVEQLTENFERFKEDKALVKQMNREAVAS